MGTAKTQILQERWDANAGRTSVRPPAPHFPASKEKRKFGSLEAWKFSFVGEGFRPTPLLGADWLIGRRLSPEGSQNQSMACEARHALQAPGPDVRFARTHGPPSASPLSRGRFVASRLHGVLRVLCDFQNTLAVLRAVARP